MSSKHVVDLRKGSQPKRTPARASGRTFAPARGERRSSPLRTRRRRLRAIALFAVLLVLGSLAYGAHYVSYLPRLTIGAVKVAGTEALEPSLIEAFVWSELDDGSYHFVSRSNIFVYPKPVIERDLVASIPRLKSASVGLAAPFSNTLVVTVTERHPYARWCESASTSSACYAMDDGGFIFAAASTSLPAAFATPYIFTGTLASAPIGTIFLPAHMQGVSALLASLQQQSGEIPISISVVNDQDLSITFQSGFYLKVSFGEDADTVARNLKLVLSSSALSGKIDRLEYVDLRFGNRVYFKLKGEDQVAQ